MLAGSFLAATLWAPPPRAFQRMRLDGGFWDSKAQIAQTDALRAEAVLEELQEREQIYLDRIRTLLKRVADLETPPAAEPPTPLLLGSATYDENTQELIANLERENNALRLSREVDVQKVGAFWLDQMSAQRGEVESARTVAATADAAVRAREEELQLLEAEFDTLGEQMEVQTETISLANARLDEVLEAFERVELTAEVQLQRTSAFWLDKLAATKAEAAQVGPLREALAAMATQREVDVQKVTAFWLERLAVHEQADTPAAAPASPAPPTPPAPTPAASADEMAASAQRSLAELRLTQLTDAGGVTSSTINSREAALLARHEAELAALRLTSETQLQQATAFWVDRCRAQAKQLSANAARETALAAALSEAEQRHEEQLQATGAFWIERLAQCRRASTADA